MYWQVNTQLAIPEHAAMLYRVMDTLLSLSAYIGVSGIGDVYSHNSSKFIVLNGRNYLYICITIVMDSNLFQFQKRKILHRMCPVRSLWIELNMWGSLTKLSNVRFSN